ncbi:AraC family transcriptional regulator [Paenibacillus sp. P96]|uniref:AraC family transcriptional regulator n=1 Tax=Paenibacillus zeirhizosphaerae TaxID=2987519 RepID=A0ABT9FSV0_9BACL|nr:AraC family transcriptional regulator [Paenibacillus sp. P96]MDP4097818.1 AraC family transcriptional regulator [Paenibacillus sp. P96]
MNRHSIYTKMVIFGCAVSIIPLLLLGYFSYQKSSESIQSHVNESRLDSLNQLRASMEQLLRSLDYTMSYLINTSLVQESIFQEMNYREFVRINHLTRELSLLKSPITKVDDVILASYVSNWLINNQGLSTFESFKYKDLLVDLMNKEAVTSWIIVKTDQISSTYNSSYNCQYAVVLAKKTPYLSAEKRGIAAVTIPTCNMADIINQPPASDIMVLDQTNRVIIHPQQDKVGARLDDLGYLDSSELSLLEGDAGEFLSKTGHHSVTYIKSPFNQWTYISFTELSELTKESRDIGWFTFYVCMFIILGSMGLVWLGSRNVYSPIRRLFQDVVQRVPEGRREKMNEIQFINDHFRDMFTSISTLTTELGRHREQAMSLFLHKLYLGTNKKSETEDKLRLFGLQDRLLPWNHFIILTLQIDLLEDTRYEQTDLDLLLFAMNNIIEEMVPPEERLPTIIIEQTHVILIGSEETNLNAFNDYIYNLTEQMQSNIRGFLDLDVSIGVSLPFHHLLYASRAYREGMEALKHRMKLGKGVIIPYFSMNSGNHSNVYFYPKQIENELLDSIRIADEHRAHKALHQWLTEVFQKEREPHEYQISLICLLNEFMILMQENGIPQKQGSGEAQSLYEQLLQMYISAEIETWFRKKLIAPIIEVFRDRQNSTYHNLSEQIIHMIQNEYNRDITLDECASRLHYNLFYVSNIFKKETGVSFSEYLAMFRLNQAKKLLIETDLPIKDIAERLSYNNPQNFIRYFRKLEGITPGQYRKNHLNKQA